MVETSETGHCTSMSFVDLLFLKNRENVSQIFEYTVYSLGVKRFQFKSLFLEEEEVPVDNIMSNVGWRPNTRNSLGR